MSRIGKRPIPVPAGVTVTIDGNVMVGEGSEGGTLARAPPEMIVKQEGASAAGERPSDESAHKALHGLTRTLVANMVEGVTTGFKKTLEITGVGYKAEIEAVRRAAVAGLVAPDRVQGAGGDQASRRRIPTHGGRRRERARNWSGRWRRRSAAIRKPSRTRARASSTQGEVIRRKAGKAGGK
jgi:large subunit ribosomal protein L6